MKSDIITHQQHPLSPSSRLVFWRMPRPAATTRAPGVRRALRRSRRRAHPAFLVDVGESAFDRLPRALRRERRRRRPVGAAIVAR